MKTLKMREIIKNINKLISATNHHQTNNVEYFISSVIQFDKSIHPMALYENYLICIFMNINENLKTEGKTIELKNEGVPTNILISAATQSTRLNLLSNLISRHSTFT